MTEPEASAVDPLEGRVIQGRWRLQRRLGVGGMGAVYLAEQLSIKGRQVAVKLLLAELARDPEYVARFRSEAERAATIADPRVVTVFDFGEDEDGGLFIAMEYVPGETLADLIKQGPLSLERAVSYGVQLAGALQRVHDAGVIHRDIKPANVMALAGGEDLKLMDFGIARAASDSERTHHTQTGLVVGTPAYMAPEQITDGHCSVRTDIYAWGLVMYALLAGRKPFEGNAASIQYKHVHEPPPPLRSLRPEVPPAVEAVVLRALDKNPERRQSSMAEVVGALRGAPTAPVTVAEDASPEPATIAVPVAARRRPVGRMVGLALLAAAVVAAALDPDIRNALVPADPAPSPVAAPADVEAAPPAADPSNAVVTDALGLSQFYLDRGEYGSAIAELEQALAGVPADPRLLAAIDKARRAQAVEAAVVGTD